MKHTDLCYFHMQLTWLDWSRSRSRSFWSRSHDRFLVSVSVSISVLHSLVSVLALVSLCSGLINKPVHEWSAFDRWKGDVTLADCLWKCVSSNAIGSNSIGCTQWCSMSRPISFNPQQWPYPPNKMSQLFPQLAPNYLVLEPLLDAILCWTLY